MRMKVYTVPNKEWGSSEVGKLLLGIFCCVFISHVLLGAFQSHFGNFQSERGRIFALFYSTFSFQGIAAILIGLFLKSQKMSWKKAFGFHIGSTPTVITHGILLGLAAFPVSLLLVGGLHVLFDFLGVEAESQEVIKLLQDKGSGFLAQSITIGVLSILVAPFVEEVLFRGIIYVHIRDMGFPQVAAWGSALFFGLIHSNSVAFIPLVLFAVFLTILYERYTNLTVCIAAHATFNAANFILSLLAEGGGVS